MGHEFIVRLNEADLRAIARDPRGCDSVDKLLREIPCYRGRSESGDCFFYDAGGEAGDGRWFSTIVPRPDRLEICTYRSEDARCIIDFLLWRLMDLCGRFEIEDA